MNKPKWILLGATLGLLAATGALLHHLKTNQRLGTPGIRATPIPGSVVMQIDLPESILDFTSTNLPQSQEVTNMLPKDTSFALRIYKSAAADFWAQGSIVMMGKDRTSIHKPEYCLPGHGLAITLKTNDVIPILSPHHYDLPVAKWFLIRTGRTESGQMFEHGGVYVYWFVAENEQTISHWQRMWWIARDLLTQGVLQRWSYVSYYTECARGQEEEAFARLSKLIAASVPEFQLPLQTAASTTLSRQ